MNVAHRPLPPVSVPGYAHLHAAHCESGVTRALLRDAGIEVSEPMVFGIGSGLFFAHLSFVRVMGHPLTTFRSVPGSIFAKATRRLGVRSERRTWARPEPAMRALDELLAAGQRVGLQVNIFWLPYIPKAMRVHFNGHNLLVVEKRGDTYVVSDPVMEDLFECPAEALARARFSGGPRFLPKGLMYRVVGGGAPDVERAARDGLAETTYRMTSIPRFVPWFAANGMRHLAARIPRWPAWMGERRACEWLAGVVRMQEEIGTGGAGFRFLFAAFLQEIGMSDASVRMTAVGDAWREFALQASRLARGRPSEGWEAVGRRVADLADAEEALFRDLDARLRGLARLELRP